MFKSVGIAYIVKLPCSENTTLTFFCSGNHAVVLLEEANNLT